jgi:hypothetical protein
MTCLTNTFVYLIDQDVKGEKKPFSFTGRFRHF